MMIQCDYDLGDIVYLTTDSDQLQRIIIGLTVRPGAIIYDLQNGTNMSSHYEMEFCKERNIILTTRE